MIQDDEPWSLDEEAFSDRGDWMPPPSAEWQESHGWKDGKPPPNGRDDYDSNGKSNGTTGHTNSPPEDDLKCSQLDPVGIAAIPARQWAYGRFLLSGSAAVLGGTDGSGKTAVAVVVALSMITGRRLLGEKVWRTGPVVIISYEDDETEWHRRIAAACSYYGIDYSEALRSIYFLRKSKSGSRISFGEMLAGPTSHADGDAIIRRLQAIKPVLLIVDPFNHAHGLEDGNNNALMARVAGEISRVAFEVCTAVLVLHHLRKGSSGNVDDLMGATSLRATFRSCRILSRMTTEEANALAITDDRWRHIRLAGSKENYAPPPDQATWYRLESVPLGNGSDNYPDGDEVGVMTTWTPPATFDGLDRATLTSIFGLIRKAHADGNDYSPNSQAKDRWLGNAIMERTGKSAAQARRIIKLWIENEVLKVEEYAHSGHGKLVQRVLLNETKAAEMTAMHRGCVNGSEL